MPGDAAVSYRLHVKLASRYRCVGFTTFVAEGGIARHDLELRQLRQVIDESFRDSITEIFELRIVRDVGERQNGDRIDRVLGRFVANLLHAGHKAIAAPRNGLDELLLARAFA